MSEPVPSLASQEEQGQFEEEIRKIVDGVAADIENGHLRYKSQARDQAAAAAKQSAYAVDPDFLPAVFKHGAQPETRKLVAAIAGRVVWACVLRLLADDETYQGLPT